MNTILKIYHYCYLVMSIGAISYILISLSAKSIISKTKETKGTR